MAGWNTVAEKQNDVALELLARLSARIAEGAPASQLSGLALAYRHLVGGAQPGNIVIEK